MNAKKLVFACCAILAMALIGCSGSSSNDAGTTDNIPPDASTQPPKIPPDASAPADCDPACGAGETCDTTQTPPACVQICNPPTGCRQGFETCNEMTQMCEPVKCGGTACELGQACFNPQTGAAGGNECTCLPRRQSSTGQVLEDTCSAYGKICDYNFDTHVAAKCKLPEEFQACKPAVGCATGFDCIQLPQQGAYCFQKCTATNDCSTLTNNCIKSAQSVLNNHCFFNVCATDSKQMVVPSEFFQPCDATAAGAQDGTCVPEYDQDDKGNYIADIGLCHQNGTAASGGACDPDATRKDLTKACPFDQACQTVKPDATDPTKTQGICRQYCNAAKTPDPVANCSSANDTCYDVSGLEATDDPKVHLGFCFPKCDVFGVGGCTTDVLGDTTGCFPTPAFDGTGACLAVIPNAPAAGANCTLSDTDPRMACGDRTYCDAPGNANTGVCRGFCDRTLCTGNVVCATCQPPGNKCGTQTGIPAGAKVGFCQAGGIPADAGTPIPPDAATPIPPDAATPIPDDAATPIPPDAGVLPDLDAGLPDLDGGI